MRLADVATAPKYYAGDERIHELGAVISGSSQGSRNAVRITNWRSEILSRLTKNQNKEIFPRSRENQ